MIRKKFQDEYKYIAGRKMFFYFTHLAYDGCFRVVKKYKKWFINPLNLIILFQNDFEEFWYPKDRVQYKKITDFYKNHPQRILDFIKVFNSDLSFLRNIIRKNLKRISEISNLVLYEDFKKIFDLILVDFQMVSVARRLDIDLLWCLEQELGIKYNRGEINNLLSNLIKSPFLSYQQKERRIFYGKIQKARHKKQVTNIIRDHAKKYYWVNLSYHNEPPLTEQDLLKRLKQDFGLHESAKSKTVFNSKKYNIPNYCKKWIKTLSYASYLKDYARGSMAEIFGWIEQYFIELSNRTGVPVLDLKMYTYLEILELIKNKTKISKKELKERKRGALFINNQIITGLEAERLLSKLKLKDKSRNMKEWAGRSVYNGNIRGKVVVAWSPEQLGNFKNKFILVVNNTNPAFVPYLKKASAIIAEEGGVTTHVSIVARELKIPTVVGIENATKMLKDGDLVEVDANKGIVRLRQRASSDK